jgi:Transposase IS4
MINWQFKTEMGMEMTEDNNVGMEQSLLDYFMACFPPQAMRNIIALTNKKLRDDDLQGMEMGELLKLFGVLILITQFEFNSQRDLWKPVSDNKFIPSPAIGMTTGMAKHQFKNLLTNITFSDQPETQPKGMSSEKYRWRLVDDFTFQSAQFLEVTYRGQQCLSITMFKGGHIVLYIVVTTSIGWVNWEVKGNLGCLVLCRFIWV